MNSRESETFDYQNNVKSPCMQIQIFLPEGFHYTQLTSIKTLHLQFFLAFLGFLVFHLFHHLPIQKDNTEVTSLVLEK